MALQNPLKNYNRTGKNAVIGGNGIGPNDPDNGNMMVDPNYGKVTPPVGPEYYGDRPELTKATMDYQKWAEENDKRLAQQREWNLHPESRNIAPPKMEGGWYDENGVLDEEQTRKVDPALFDAYKAKIAGITGTNPYDVATPEPSLGFDSGGSAAQIPNQMANIPTEEQQRIAQGLPPAEQVNDYGSSGQQPQPEPQGATLDAVKQGYTAKMMGLVPNSPAMPKKPQIWGRI